IGRVVEHLDFEKFPRVVERRHGVDQALDDVDFVVQGELNGDARKGRQVSRRARLVAAMPVIEDDHQNPVRAVGREEREDRVVEDQRRDLRGFTRHGISNRWLLLAAGQAVAVGLLLRPPARDSLVPYLLLFLAGSLVAIHAARSLSASRGGFLLLCGGLLRATLLWRQPDLSDDVYRYLWDGRVARAGISPYAYAPDDP